MRLLHVGCGGDPLPPWFGEANETRLDIDPGVKPHIVADMTDLGGIGEYDVLWCCHALEHLHPLNVPKALGEFLRILRPGGAAMIVVPDLEGVEPTSTVLFTAPVGPVTGRDLIYGHAELSQRSPFMLHQTGFVRSTLHGAIAAAGFSQAEARRLPDYNLFGLGIK